MIDREPVMARAWAAGALAASVLSLGAAGIAHAADLTVTDAVIRAAGPGVPNTAGYMTIVNTGAAADQLLSASCACAGKVDVHLSHVMNGTAMMMPTGPVAIPAHGQVRFAPGGYHLMITGLKAPLEDGGSQAVDLKFQHAGTLKVAFAVHSRISAGPAAPAAPMTMPMGH